MGQHALYTKEQLAYERSIGLDLSDEANENFYAPGDTRRWYREEFEAFMASKPNWAETTKEEHRKLFTGTVCFYPNGNFEHI